MKDLKQESLTYKVKEDEKLTLIHFELDGILDINDLPDIVENAPETNTKKGVCVSRRGPTWLFSAFTEVYHSCAFFGTYEPRKKACVITASHKNPYKIGQEIPVDLTELQDG